RGGGGAGSRSGPWTRPPCTSNPTPRPGVRGRGRERSCLGVLPSGILSRVRILYGVVGEGMGHATRSRVIIEHLAALGHQIKIVVSGRAHRFLQDRLKHLPSVTLEEIEGLTLTYFGNELDRSASIYE